MARLGWERWTALGVCAFAVFYVVAFTTTGIDFDDTDRAVLAHYASGSVRAKEVVAFFLIAAAALSLVVESFVTVNAKNPRNIIATWQQDLGFAARSDPIGTSRDGGRTWTRVTIPGLTRCTGGSYDAASDPWVSAGPGGTV